MYTDISIKKNVMANILNHLLPDVEPQERTEESFQSNQMVGFYLVPVSCYLEAPYTKCQVLSIFPLSFENCKAHLSKTSTTFVLRLPHRRLFEAPYCKSRSFSDECTGHLL